MKNQDSTRKPKNNQGFALIATISVMVLLVMIALAMLSLSSVEIRQQANSAHQNKAQANARLGLMVALGELQKYAGADRRVTASASILDTAVDVNKRNWTTVWDTSDWDVQNPINSRDAAYMAALVSRRDANLPTTATAAVSELVSAVPAGDPNWINLVDSGSVNSSDDYVAAEKIDVDDGTSAGGSYAYWVGDEGVKARFDVKKDINHVSEQWAKAGRMGTPGGSGIHKISGLDDYKDNYLTGQANVEDLDKFINFRSLDFSAVNRQALKGHFHNITTSHTGLLTDNRWGGIRRDLSTAFEMDAVDFGNIDEFSASGEQNLTGNYSIFAPAELTTNPLYYSEQTDRELGYLYEVAVNNTQRYRGPTWDLLRNHYRIYKKERNGLNYRGFSPSSSDALVSHGVVPFSYINDPGTTSANSSLGGQIAGPHYASGTTYQIPIVTEHGKGGGYDIRAGGRTQPTVQKITPQLLRSILVFGLAKTGNQYFLTINPYFVVHNPYNQPLEFYSMSVDLNALASLVEFRANYESVSSGGMADKVFRPSEGWNIKALQSFRLAPAPSGYRLEPGEIKVMSALGGNYQNVGDGTLQGAGGIVKTISLNELGYNENGGIYLGDLGEVIDAVPNSVITISATAKREASPAAFFARLLHPLNAFGAAEAIDDLESYNDDAPFNRHHDYERISLIMQSRIITQNRGTLSETRSVNESQIPNVADGSLYLYAMDFGLKDFSGDVAVMSDFNCRAMGFGPRDYDGLDEIAPNWEYEIKPTDLLDLQLADANGNSYWGAGKTASDGGGAKIVLFDLPRSPLTSLAALQHADTSKFNFHAMHSIANSRIQVGQTDPTKIFNRLAAKQWPTIPKHQIDTSWASNEALWDRYYFSGINWGAANGQPFSTHDEATAALTGPNPLNALANPRMTLVSSVSDPNELKDYTKLGKYLGILGAFNVNSTSVEAWKAVLASLSGREISYLAGTGLQDLAIDDTVSPMSRFTTPAGVENDSYNGFRALSDTELTSLAEAIVDQVRLRGPFMGLSDFVNRRLVDDNTGMAGAIQTAIDESGINSAVAIGSTNGNRLEQSSLDANQGMATHLNQGDVLTPLASIIATRSDTFMVRAYGDSKDANGNIRARAWCEATVQRTPELVGSSSEPATVKHPDYPTGNSTAEPILRQWAENPNLSEENKNFGRKFIVKSFRWLASNEI